MDCPACGYHDPFHVSWFDVEKEAADPHYFKEWDEELWTALQDASWIEFGDYMYHRTATSVYRWKIAVLAAKRGGRIEWDPRPANKAGEKLGSRLIPKLTKWLEAA